LEQKVDFAIDYSKGYYTSPHLLFPCPVSDV
jgi:hypothetical protein